MSIFDELETAALEKIIDSDLENAAQYRYNSGAGDGFNAELEHQGAYIRNIKVAIARGQTNNNSNYIGTTSETDIAEGDVLEIVNDRGKKRRWTVTGFKPTKEHTLLELDEVRNAP